ncbi:uncharacterized protein LOC131876109 [Cryptomeria japonica]|uniref:uncharacterized protein LOC131876109 n=1 Tax=Cryptomeria japonica TaxID=3369 RepID=UPI0027DA2D63|nr:uncharacterized protein LOC131876109 [Cryptomeria japonica]
MTEKVANQTSFTKDEVKKEREKYAQKEAKKETKKPKVDPVPSKEKPKGTKSTPALVAQDRKPSPSIKGVLKQKENPKRTYIVAFLVVSETESQEEARRAKKKGDFVRLVKKGQSSGAQKRKKAKSDIAPTGRSQRGRQVKTQLNKYLKSGNIQGNSESRWKGKTSC